MIFMGLVLAVAAVGLGTAIVVGSAGAAQLTAFGATMPGVTEERQVFIAGVVVAIVFVIGMTLARLGFRRSMGVRRQLRDLQYEREESLQALEMEKRQLERELAQVRRNAPPLRSSTS